MRSFGSLFAGLLLALACSPANATCPTFHTLTNGTTADANQVMDNFNYVLGCPNFTGNVGVGTSTPNSMLQIVAPSGTNASFGMDVNSTPSSTASTMRFTRQGVNRFAIAGTDGNGGVDDFAIFRYDDSGTYLGTAFTILRASGNVGINTGTPSYTLHVNGSVAGTSAYNNLSDVRLKKNVRPISDALSLIERLQGVRFEWRTQKERPVGKNLNLPTNEPQVGFVAQDLEQVLPEAVTTAKGPDAIKSVAESKVVPVLVEAIKELAAANSKQATQIERLQKEMAALQRRGALRTAENRNL